MIINFGSINIDHVYRVAKLPQPGETVPSTGYEKFLGGKGINQSIAIAKSGGRVRHVGAVGTDGDWALEEIRNFGVEHDHIKTLEGATGHAIITVDHGGENQILIEGGANRRLSKEMIVQALSDAVSNTDWILIQNETNLTLQIAKIARKKGLKIAYAAAPFVRETVLELLPLIDLLAINESEANELAAQTGMDFSSLPVAECLVTLGARGALHFKDGVKRQQPAYKVEPVDTTGAGDTFLGAFLARYTRGDAPQTALHFAAAASAVQVTRAGAAAAIPHSTEVENFISTAERP